MAASEIRVRFAPSPTGYLHIGGLRTALYNYLFARRHGGTVVLRIEDTDRSRYVEGAVGDLLHTLKQAGLEFDEGPAQGGSYGPYVQSQRLQLYHRHADRLLAEGKAYRCFCSAGELKQAREQQLAEKRSPAYNRRCRSLADAEIEEKLNSGLPHTLRMKTPLTGELQLQDIVRGEIRMGHDVIDDQILLKSDGYPTYHLANVVDDHDMKITHVIRGEEWLPSTAKHVLLYAYLGWQPPQFAHLPLLLNPDRSKLSKRQGDVAVEDYLAKGFLPEALINFVALLGWNTSDDQELYTMEELIGQFDLDRVGKAGAVFDAEKLRWFNGRYLRALPPGRLAGLCRPFMQQAGFDTGDEQRTENLAVALQKHLTMPSDIAGYMDIFVSPEATPENEEAAALLGTEESNTVLREFASIVSGVDPWKRDLIKEAIKKVQRSTGIKGKGLFIPLRVALTGKLHGPDLPVIAEIFGREKTLQRVTSRH